MLFGGSEIPVCQSIGLRVGLELIGKCQHVLVDEPPCLKHLMVVSFLLLICLVEIPIEIHLGILLEEFEHLLLGLVQHIEAHNGKLLLLNPFLEIRHFLLRYCFLSFTQSLIIGQFPTQSTHHIALQHSLVRQARSSEIIAETGVDGRQYLPKTHVVLLQKRGDVEVLEILLQGFHLFLREIVETGEVVEVGDITEQLLRIDMVVVDVLKVGQHEFAPRIELVEGFIHHFPILLICLFVCLIETANQFYRVSHFQRGERLEKFGNGEICRCPQRSIGYGEYVLIEKQTGTLIRKNNRQILKITITLLVQILCY